MRASLPIVVVLALGVTACAGEEPAAPPASVAPQPDPTTEQRDDAPGESIAPPDGEMVTVAAVLDGDSLAVERDGRREEVRLAGINSPEADECYGGEARSLMQQLVGDEVILVAVAGGEDVDQFGRLLRDVWAGNAWLNVAMVEAGAAIALQTGTPAEERLVAAEDAAWQAGSGLWGSAVCGPFTPGLRITDVRYDPPGRDFENATEESVLLQNDGDAALDIGGWVLRDESSTHRYRFPAGLTLAPGEARRVRTGCGSDAGLDLYWCAGDAVWSNGGDTVIVQTADGTVVDRWKYAGDF